MQNPEHRNHHQNFDHIKKTEHKHYTKEKLE